MIEYCVRCFLWAQKSRIQIKQMRVANGQKRLISHQLPDYVNETIKRSGAPYRFVDVKRAQAIFRDLTQVSPIVLATLREVIGQK